MPHYLINTLPDIENKKYLELGTFDGYHIKSILCKDKTAVDIKYLANYIMTTDDFFKQLSDNIKYDLIYIDADHYCESVKKDFNNASDHLTETGIIFIHDLFPDNIELTQPQYCNNGYIFLDCLLKQNYPNVYVLKEDYGLTFVKYPKLKINDLNLNLSYDEFIRKNYKRYSIQEALVILNE